MYTLAADTDFWVEMDVFILIANALMSPFCVLVMWGKFPNGVTQADIIAPMHFDYKV